MSAHSILSRRIREKREAVDRCLARREASSTYCTVLNLAGSALATAGGAFVALSPSTARFGIGVAIALCSAAAAVAAGLKRMLFDREMELLRAGAARLENLALNLDNHRVRAGDATDEFNAINASLPRLRPRQPLLYRVRGEILAPREGAVVPRYFTASGRVEGVKEEEVRIWLTVDRNGKHWPKNGPVARGGHGWEVKVHHTTPGTFGLTLWAVDPEVDRELNQWLAEGAREGHFPGFAQFANASILDHVDGLRLEPRGGDAAGEPSAAGRIPRRRRPRRPGDADVVL